MGLKVKKTYKASRLSENEHSWHRSFVFRMPGMQQKARSTPSSTRRSTSSSSLPITSGAWPSRTAGPVATSWISSTSCVAPSRSSHTCRWASLSTHSLVVVLCSFIYTTLCVFPVVVLNVCRAVCTCVRACVWWSCRTSCWRVCSFYCASVILWGQKELFETPTKTQGVERREKTNV